MHRSFIQSAARRAFLRTTGGLGVAALAGWATPAAAKTTDVVVMTSYPDELVARFEAAFEKANPGYRLRVVWRAGSDALPTLRKPGPEGVDVVWSPSPRNFSVLKGEGLLRKLDIDRTGLPGQIGNTRIDDPDGYYAAFEVAGYGFVVNPDYLKARGLPEPADWADLADARYAGHVVLPNPGRVGFAPVLADIPLQAYGWEQGWAMWSAVTANSTLVNAGGTFVGDEVAEGRRGVGMSIDFFASGAIARGAPLRFVYPKNGGLNPAHVGMMVNGRNPAGARAFVAFLLSAEGQKLLVHPDIRRLPVRPSVYANLPVAYHNPFAAAAAGGYGYDAERGLGRLPVIAALYETAFAQRRDKLAALWSRARAGSGARAEEARLLLGKVPLSEAQADAPELQRIFATRGDDPRAEVAAAEQERKWAAECDVRLDFIDKLLEQA